MRQTWEEIGLDLAESDFTCVGQLDDREITTSLGKRLLMILSPFGQLSIPPSILFLPNPSSFPPTYPNRNPYRAHSRNYSPLGTIERALPRAHWSEFHFSTSLVHGHS
jgi:hypothetical protein